jgi:hypothetical protein
MNLTEKQVVHWINHNHAAKIKVGKAGEFTPAGSMILHKVRVSCLATAL